MRCGGILVRGNIGSRLGRPASMGMRMRACASHFCSMQQLPSTTMMAERCSPGPIPRLQVHKAYNMGWAEGHLWSAEVALPPGTQLEFKVGPSS